jgi:hypothetical protein
MHVPVVEGPQSGQVHGRIASGIFSWTVPLGPNGRQPTRELETRIRAEVGNGMVADRLKRSQAALRRFSHRSGDDEIGIPHRTAAWRALRRRRSPISAYLHCARCRMPAGASSGVPQSKGGSGA